MDMENGYKILRQISDDDKKADAAVLSIGSQEELKEKQKQWRSLWLDMLGDMPEKTPLQPQITGKIRCEGYTVEKILFQSLPGIYVTGYLYLPDDPRFRAPYPGLLLVNGHSDLGKLHDRYCDMAVMAVKSGFAVFTPDPYSQGERVQRSAKYPWKECAVEHASLGARSWLVGWNFARFRIWDAVRSIDYMETRPELDLSKLAVVGCSGGGTMSTYMQAFDDRIKVACPSCYVSSLREVIGERGVHDAEQFFFGQLPRGFNHAVMLAMGQPRTALMLDARHSDYFPIAGIRSTTALIEKFRDKLGIKTPFALFSSDGSHGWPLCGRTATLSWLEYTVPADPIPRSRTHCNADRTGPRSARIQIPVHADCGGSGPPSEITQNRPFPAAGYRPEICRHPSSGPTAARTRSVSARFQMVVSFRFGRDFRGTVCGDPRGGRPLPDRGTCGNVFEKGAGREKSQWRQAGSSACGRRPVHCGGSCLCGGTPAFFLCGIQKSPEKLDRYADRSRSCSRLICRNGLGSAERI